MVRDPMPGGSGQLYAGNDYSLGKNGENYAVCLGRLFTCAMISPISNLDFHFPDLEVSDSSQAQSFSVHFEQQVVDAARDNVEGLVGQKFGKRKFLIKKLRL